MLMLSQRVTGAGQGEKSMRALRNTLQNLFHAIELQIRHQCILLDNNPRKALQSRWHQLYMLLQRLMHETDMRLQRCVAVVMPVLREKMIVQDIGNDPGKSSVRLDEVIPCS